MAKQSTETPILDLIGTVTEASIEATDLDPKTLMMVRFAALIGVDAPPSSYLMNLTVGAEVGLDEEAARQVIMTVLPIVGTPHVVAALENIGRALGLVIELAELEEESKAGR